MSKPFIGIKRAWYGDVIKSITSDVAGLSAAELATQVGKMTEIANVHDDTWGYEESDPEVTEYINELSGLPYYKDAEKAGVPTATITIGQYDFATKAALQGGKSTAEKWERSEQTAVIEKCFVFQTKTGNYIVFPKASCVAKGALVQKNIGLSVSAVPLETGVKGLASEIWFDGSKVTLA